MMVPAERQPELERPDEQERAGRQRPEREGPDGLERPQGYERRPRSERQPEGRPEEDRGADAAAGPLPATGTGRGPSPAGEPGRGGAAFDPNGDPEWEWDLDGPPPGDRPIRALIVDDEYPARAELRYRLSREPGVEITGEAATAREALRLIGALDYDVVFLDIAMPGISGLELAERLKQQPGAPYVIFTTAYDEYAVKAFEARALDYLLKPYSDDRLREALSRVRERLALRGVQGRRELRRRRWRDPRPQEPERRRVRRRQVGYRRRRGGQGRQRRPTMRLHRAPRRERGAGRLRQAVAVGGPGRAG